MSTQVTLQVDVEDYDLKGNDFMGRLLGVLKGCGAFTFMRVVSFAILRQFGPRARAWPVC